MKKFTQLFSFFILTALLITGFLWKYSSNLILYTNAAPNLSTTGVYASTYYCDPAISGSCVAGNPSNIPGSDYSYVYEIDQTTGAKIGAYVARIPRTTGIAISPDGSKLYYTIEYSNATGYPANSNRYIYVIDMASLVNPDSVVPTTFASLASNWVGGDVSTPRLGVAPNGHVFAITTAGSNLFEFDAAGTLVQGPTQVTTPSPVAGNTLSGGGSGSIVNGSTISTLQPGGDIAISSTGQAYILDNAANFWQINLISPSGGLKHLGILNFSTIAQTAGIAFTQSGELVVMDAEHSTFPTITGKTINHDVGKITLDGSTGGLASISVLGQFGTSNTYSGGPDLNGRSADAASANFPDISPDFSVVKTVSDLTTPIAFTDASGTTASASQGDILEYKIRIKNTGKLNSTGTTFIDMLPLGTTYVLGSTSINGAGIADVSGQFPCLPPLGCSINSPGAPAGTVYTDTIPTSSTNDVLVSFRVTIDLNRTTPVSNSGTVDYTDSNLYNGPVDSNIVTTPILIPNQPPIATDDTYVTTYNTPVNVLPITWTIPNGSDSDPDNDTLTVIDINGTTLISNTATGPIAVTGGTVSVLADGTITFTPTLNFTGTASFSYTISDGNGGTDTATETIKIVHSTIDKQANTSTYSTLNQTINYTYTITNAGSQNLIAPYSVSDNKITGITCPQTPSPLLPGGTITCTASYNITQTDLNNGSVTNIANATVGYNDGSTNKTYTTGNDTVTINTISNPKIELEKEGVFNDENNDTYAQVGETISYTFKVTNTGNVTLTNVTITDPVITIIGTPIASLAPGASNSVAYTGTYVLTQADIDAGHKDNIATATGTPPTGSNVTDQSDDPNDLTNVDPDEDGDPDDPTVIPLPQNPKIELEKEGVFNDENNDTYAQVGETISYTFKVTNTGNVTLTNVTITDPVITITGTPIASLAPGASNSVAYTGTYVLTQADIDTGHKDNIATATGTPPTGSNVTDQSDDPNDLTNVDPDEDGDPDDPTVIPLPQNPKIELEKEGVFNDENNDTYAQVGETISYTFKVTNTGNVTLTNVTITDPVITIIGTPIASLAPGASNSVAYTGTYVLTQADIDTGHKDNIATATGTPPTGSNVTDQSDDPNDLTNVDPDQDGDPDDPTVIPLPQNPKIELSKSANTNFYKAVGEIIEYTFIAKNTGNVTLDGPIKINDNKMGVLTCSDDGLKVGQQITCKFNYVITQSDLSGDKVTNIAKATAIFKGNPILSNEPTVTIIKELPKTGANFNIFLMLFSLSLVISSLKVTTKRLSF